MTNILVRDWRITSQVKSKRKNHNFIGQTMKGNRGESQLGIKLNNCYKYNNHCLMFTSFQFTSLSPFICLSLPFFLSNLKNSLTDAVHAIKMINLLLREQMTKRNLKWLSGRKEEMSYSLKDLERKKDRLLETWYDLNCC